jgi:hypothetical protein
VGRGRPRFYGAAGLTQTIQFGYGIRHFSFTKNFVRNSCDAPGRKCRVGAAYALHLFVRKKGRFFRLGSHAELNCPDKRSLASPKGP